MESAGDITTSGPYRDARAVRSLQHVDEHVTARISEGARVDSTPAAINGFADKHELTPRPSPSKTALQLMSDGSRSLSAKSSPGSLRSKRTSPLPMTSANGEAAGTGGWNDPPGSVFGATDATGHLLGAKGLSSLSRSSSRINLEEYGGSLAVRPISRGPGGDDPGGP
jgi:hypothetical protein